MVSSQDGTLDIGISIFLLELVGFHSLWAGLRIPFLIMFKPERLCTHCLNFFEKSYCDQIYFYLLLFLELKMQSNLIY